MSNKAKEPIRVLQFVTIMDMGGLETMLMNYYRNIDRSKIQFDFIVHREERGAYDDEIERLGGKIYRLPPITFLNLHKYRKQLKSFFASHPEYKIVHSHLDALSALPLYVAKESSVPVRIAHSHNNSFDKDLKAPVRNSTKRLIKYTATDLAGCSEEAIHFMFGSSVKKYNVIKNAIDTKEFSYSPQKRNKIRKELGIKKNCLLVGHVGRFSYQKNHNLLIDIFKEINLINSDSKLILIGDGKLKPSIEKKVLDLGLSEMVLFMSNRTDVSDLMQAMDVFVLPSRYEGMPVVSIEAQATGLSAFFSSVITKSIKATSSCHFINLDTPAINWAEQITNIEEVSRKGRSDQIRSAGYSIFEEQKKLTVFYSQKFNKSVTGAFYG